MLSVSLDVSNHRDAIRAAAAALADAGEVEAAKEHFIRLADHKVRESSPINSILSLHNTALKGVQ